MQKFQTFKFELNSLKEYKRYKDPKYVIEKEATHRDRNMLVLVIVGNDSAKTYPISIIAPVWYLLNPIILMPIRQNETPKTLLMIQFFVIT